MGDRAEVEVRRAGVEDAGEVARLLHAFNTEFDEYTPGVEALTETARRMIAAGQMTVLLAGEGPDGIADLRFHPSVWTGSVDAHLEELYVVPARRGEGIGRALLEAAVATARAAGATWFGIVTSEADRAAMRLYASAGFSDRDGPDGPLFRYFERQL